MALPQPLHLLREERTVALGQIPLVRLECPTPTSSFADWNPSLVARFHIDRKAIREQADRPTTARRCSAASSSVAWERETL